MTASNYNPAHKAVLDGLLIGMPGVKASKAFGYPAYKVNGKVFAFVGGNAISIKLPVSRVQELIANHSGAKPFQPADGIIWREWVSIFRADSEDYAQDVALFEESSQFVAG